MVVLQEENKYYYDSSNILYSEYHEDERELHIQFNCGGLYKYKGITPMINEEFITNKSQGKFFNSFIKNHKLIETELITKHSKDVMVEMKQKIIKD